MKVERVNIPTTRKVGDLNIGDGFVIAGCEYVVVDLCNAIKEIYNYDYIFALIVSNPLGPIVSQLNKTVVCMPTKLKIETN